MMTSAPSADVAKPANVTPEKLDTNQQTRALPWWGGLHWFAITYCVSQPYNFHFVKKPSNGGAKKGGGAEAKDGLCDVAGLVAGCTADSIHAIEVNGDIVWSGVIDRDGSHVEHSGDVVVEGIGTFRLAWGTETAAGDWLILNSGGEEHPHYRGQCVLEVRNLNCGSSESLPNIRVLLDRAPNFDGIYGGRVREGINPIAALSELVENEFFGLGLSGVIDVPAANDVAYALNTRTKIVAIPGNPTHEARMGYFAPYLSDRQSFGSILAGIMENFDGWARRKGEKLELGYFTHPGTVPTDLATLTLHDLIDDPDFANPGLDDPDVITDAIVTGPDLDWNLEDSYQKAGNDAVRDRLQQLRPQTYARPFLITSYQQKEQAQELANFYGQAAKETTLKWRREKVVAPDGVTPLQPGDRFLLNYGPSGLLQVFRITKRSDPASGGAVTLTVMPERGLSPLAYVPAADPAPARPAKLAAVSIVHARMFQLPVLWPEVPALPAFVALAERPSGPSAGFRINFSVADATYDYIAGAVDWALRGVQVTSTLSTGATALRISASGYDLNLLEDQTAAAQSDDTLLLVVDNEVMSIGGVTAVGGGLYDLTVLRGRCGSGAATHAAGDVCYIIPRAELTIVTHAELPRTSATRYFKLQAYTPNDTEDLSTALKLAVGVTSTLPGAPTGVTYVAGTAGDYGRAQPFQGNVRAFAVRINYLPSSFDPVDYYEYVLTGTDTDAAADSAARYRADGLEVIAISGTPLIAYFRVRAVKDGLPGPWGGGGVNLNLGYWGLPARDMVEQNSDAVTVTGISTGNGASVAKVLARCPYAGHVTATGGAASEDFNLDLTGRGFSTRPDTGLLTTGSPDFGVEYWPGTAGNSASNAVITLYRRDGAPIGAGAEIDLNGEFTEID